MNDILTLYRDRLTDLTARNQSLRLLRLVHKNHADLAAFSKVLPGAESRILQGVLAHQGDVPLLSANSFEEEEMLFGQRLMRLKRETDLIEQETGANAFYVGYGFLEGYLVEGFYLRCPLLFYAAKLKKKPIRNVQYWVLEFDDAEPPFLNRTFLLALQKFLGIQLMEQLQEALAELPTDGNVLLYLLRFLQKNKLNVRLGDNSSSLSPFPSLKRDDVPDQQKEFLLQPYCVMGKFQQSTSTLLRDYEELLQTEPQEGLLRSLFRPTEEEELDPIDHEILNRVQERETHFVLETDASQEAVVVASRERQGLIVHGPPGTGKSQVIVNLVADRMAQGKRVLVVCQKPAALDVVYNRLGQIGLQQHVALVHDHNASRARVYAKAHAVIERQAGSVQDHTRISDELQTLGEHLNRIASSLHGERSFGKTLFQLYSSANWNPEMIVDVADCLADMTFDKLQSHLVDLRNLFELMQKYDHPSYPWQRRKSFASLTVVHHQELQSILQRLVEDVQKGLQIRSHAELQYTPRYYLEHREALQRLQQAVLILQNKNMFRHLLMFYRDEEREFENDEQMHKVKQTYGSLHRDIERVSARPAPTTHLTEEEAAYWLTKIQSFLELNQKRLTRYLNSAWYGARKELQAHCQAHGILFEGSAVRKYMESIESFLLFEQLRKTALGQAFYADVSTSNEIEEWQKWIRQKGKAIEFLELFVQAQTVFPDWLQNPQNTEDLQRYLETAFQQNLSSLAELVVITERMQTTVGALGNYLEDEEGQTIEQELYQGIYDLERYQNLLQSLQSFDSLSRLDQMKSEMGEWRSRLLARCLEKAPIDQTAQLVEHWAELIENSFLHAWILQVEAQEPHVKDVSTEIYESNRRRYKELLQQKRSWTPTYIDHRLARQALEVGGKSRQQIKSQAGRKRSPMTLRQLMAAFPEDLLKLIPCWLCTPEAVSAIFPLQQNLFDLVIFDEASQCPVENAIPSLYRAKQVVVAGDEKQLPPTSFFRAVADDGEEEEDNEVYVDRLDTQAKSLLEWSKARFADQWLTWHYRSQHPELIAFSNYAFYGQRIEIAPSLSYESSTPPIEFIQVEGTWINQQNRIEAERIVDVVLDILKNDAKTPTLGIITFNSKQTELINDVFDQRASRDPEVQLLLESARQRKREDEHVGLFVKNIENVQGDERDIILFSVAYAENADGKMVANFGPLSQEAGENRLNVAITRARQKVYLICSFDPSQWTRAETYAKGVRLLKRYLEYGKAVSEGRTEAVHSILNGLVDAVGVQEEHYQIRYDSPFEQQVREALLAHQLQVNTQIGFSGYRIDLGVLNPNHATRYILGIECDGATYHSSKIARERDLYRQRFLENKGWTIHRIWSRNWWKSPEQEIAQVLNRIEQLIQQERESSSKQTDATAHAK